MQYFGKLRTKNTESTFAVAVRNLIHKKQTFETEVTKSTKIIRLENDSYIYNEDGKLEPHLMQLIKKVKADAANYELGNKTQLDSYTINWFKHFYNLELEQEFNCVKIDLKSAYWETAKKLGLISIETDHYLRKVFNPEVDVKSYKKARLISLGSLARISENKMYLFGDCLDRYEKVSPFRYLFFEVSYYVDKLMCDIANKILSYDSTLLFFYYFDCFFIVDCPTIKNEVINEINNCGYDCSVEKGILRFDSINQKVTVSTVKDSYSYSYKFEREPIKYEKQKNYKSEQTKLFNFTTY